MDPVPRRSRIALDYDSGWGPLQKSLIRMIASLTPDQLGLRSSHQMWTVGTAAAHIAAGRARWWHNWMGEGDEAFAALTRFGGDSLASADIAGAHEVTAGVIGDSIARWRDTDLDLAFGNPAQPERGLRSRRWIIWHVLEHDLFHAGEISQVLGMHGLPGLDISDRRPGA